MNDEEKKPEEDLTPVASNNEETQEDPSEVTEIDIAPTTEIDTVEEKNLPDDQDAQEEVALEDSNLTQHSHDHSSLLKIVDGKFTCSECENEVEPETNTIEGVVKADLEQIKSDLEQFPTKVVYGICPVCGMEFVFRYKDGELWLEPSDLEK